MKNNTKTNMRKAAVKRSVRMGKACYTRNDYRRIVSIVIADGYNTPKAAAERPKLTAAEKRKAAEEKKKAAEQAAYIEWYNSSEQWLYRYTRKLAASKVRKINQSAGLALSTADIDDISNIMLTSFWTWAAELYDDIFMYVDEQREVAANCEDEWGALYNNIGCHCYDGVKEYIAAFRKDTGINAHCYRLDESRDGEIIDETKHINSIIAGKELPQGSTIEAADYLVRLKNNLTAIQRRILGGLAQGNLRETICEDCGISRATYFREIKRIREIAEKLDTCGVLNRYRKITAKQRSNRNTQLKAYIAAMDANLTPEQAADVEDYLKVIRWTADTNGKTNKRKA